MDPPGRVGIDRQDRLTLSLSLSLDKGMNPFFPPFTLIVESTHRLVIIIMRGERPVDHRAARRAIKQSQLIFCHASCSINCDGRCFARDDLRSRSENVANSPEFQGGWNLGHATIDHQLARYSFAGLCTLDLSSQF